MAIRTLSELFLVAARYDKEACLMHKVGGRYVAVSTAELVRQVRQIARALVDSGIRPGDRVALMAENGPHWPAVDFATLCIGAALVPIYPTLLPEGAAYVARDSGSRVLFVQGHGAARGPPGGARRDAAQSNGSWPSTSTRSGRTWAEATAGVETLEAFMARGAGAERPGSRRRTAQAKPEDLATLIYTSGTTGDPKGRHADARQPGLERSSPAAKCLGLEGSFTALSFLPLSHSFERLVDYCYFLQGHHHRLRRVGPDRGGEPPRGETARLRRRAAGLREGHGAGPRERHRCRRLKAKIFRWAVGVGREALPKRLAFEPLGLKVRIADKLVFSKIRERLGGRFVFAMSGGAPLGRDVAEFFWGAGIPIYEGYGLTETSPVISVNTRGATRLGTVGRPMPRIEVRIAEDGEILSRGPNIMRGYYGKPEATAEAIDGDGWFHTGDIGHLDDDGFLVITDRKKELIVNAYGKNIAPAPIENALKASRWISQAVVIGDRRQYLAALIVPDFDVLKGWAASEKVGGTLEEQLASPELRAIFQARGRCRERAPGALRADPRLGAGAGRVHPRGRRAHPDPEGEAPGDQHQVQGDPRPPLRRGRRREAPISDAGLPPRGRRGPPRDADLRPAGQEGQHLHPRGPGGARSAAGRARRPGRHRLPRPAVGEGRDVHRRRRCRGDRRRQPIRIRPSPDRATATGSSRPGRACPFPPSRRSPGPASAAARSSPWHRPTSSSPTARTCGSACPRSSSGSSLPGAAACVCRAGSGWSRPSTSSSPARRSPGGRRCGSASPTPSSRRRDSSTTCATSRAARSAASGRRRAPGRPEAPAARRARAAAGSCFDQARKKTASVTRGRYPAPLAALEVVRIGLEKGPARRLRRRSAGGARARYFAHRQEPDPPLRTHGGRQEGRLRRRRARRRRSAARRFSAPESWAAGSPSSSPTRPVCRCGSRTSSPAPCRPRCSTPRRSSTSRSAAGGCNPPRCGARWAFSSRRSRTAGLGELATSWSRPWSRIWP